MTVWLESDDEKIKKLAASGLSAAAIAMEIGGGRSRNAIIGRLHRLKVPLLLPSGRSGKKRKPKQPHKPKPRLISETIAAEPVAESEAFTESLSNWPLINFDNLEQNSCRWPIGEMYCGGPSLNGKPYCSRHSATALREPAKIRKQIKYGWRR